VSIPLPQLEKTVLTEQYNFDAGYALAALDASEREQTLAFAREIDPANPTRLSAYGAAEQSGMRMWIDVALHAVAQGDPFKGRQLIDKLLERLRSWERLCAPRRFLFFYRASFPRLRAVYQQAGPAIERAADALLDESVALRRTSKILERMARENEEHLLRLSTYLLCGQLRLQAPRDDSDDPQALERLRRRLHDLAVTRQINLQTRAQFILLLDGNERMIETLERTLRHTLPLWKAQVLVALGLSAQADARRETLRAEQALQKSATRTGATTKKLAQKVRLSGPRVDRDALRESNRVLLDSVSALRAAMLGQYTQGERVQKALREPMLTSSETGA
jgi:uncharacterized protein YaaN involved in tellurite resistance